MSVDEKILKALDEGLLTAFENGTVLNKKGDEIGNNDSNILTVTVDGERITTRRHRVVWIRFKGLPDSNKSVCHRPGTPYCLENFYVVLPTVEQPKEIISPFSPNQKDKPLNDKTVTELRKEYKHNPFSMRARSEILGVSYPSLRYALNGKNFKHLEEPPVNTFQSTAIRTFKEKPKVGRRMFVPDGLVEAPRAIGENTETVTIRRKSVDKPNAPDKVFRTEKLEYKFIKNRRIALHNNTNERALEQYNRSAGTPERLELIRDIAEKMKREGRL